MAEYKYYICSKCSRITDINFKDPTGPMFLNDLVDRTSRSISYICEDCRKKKESFREFYFLVEFNRIPMINENAFNEMKSHLKTILIQKKS